MVLSVPERSARKDASTTGSGTDGWSTCSAAALGLRGARVLFGGGDVSGSGSAAACVLGARGVLDRARGGWSDDGGSSSPGGAATGSATASLGFRGARTLLGGAAAASAATIWPSICGGRGGLFG